MIGLLHDGRTRTEREEIRWYVWYVWCVWCVERSSCIRSTIKKDDKFISNCSHINPFPSSVPFQRRARGPPERVGSGRGRAHTCRAGTVGRQGETWDAGNCIGIHPTHAHRVTVNEREGSVIGKSRVRGTWEVIIRRRRVRGICLQVWECDRNSKLK